MMAQTNPRSRLAEIIRVFINYNVVPNFVQQKNPEQVKKAFEELGPTFIKIGQMLSVREDLLSSAFTQTFKTLQDSVPSDTFSTVRRSKQNFLFHYQIYSMIFPNRLLPLLLWGRLIVPS